MRPTEDDVQLFLTDPSCNFQPDDPDWCRARALLQEACKNYVHMVQNQSDKNLLSRIIQACENLMIVLVE